MIHDVDESLRQLIRRDVLNGSNVEIGFEGPTREWAARRSGPALNLYLYDIVEDLRRREVQFQEVREQGVVVERRLPPRQYRLSYLVTAWTQRPEDEHRILAAVLSCFIRAEALPPEILQGALADSDDEVRVTIGLPLPGDRQLSDVWSALGGELKAALDLVVTVPFETRRRQTVGPLVIEEPRITLVGPEGQKEQAPGPQGRSQPEEQIPPLIAAETVDGGKPGTGRRFEMRAVPRR
ncbi:MAG: DUF4255 domain-containing protein [Actinomycetota bacterium]